MFESVAAFDGDSTITRTLPEGLEIFFSAVFLVVVLDLVPAVDFFADTFLFEVGIVITPV